MTNVTLNLTKWWFTYLGQHMIGAPLLAGLILLAGVVWLYSQNRASIEFYILSLLPIVMVLSREDMGYLPSVTAPLLIIVLAFGVGVGIYRFLFSR